MGGQTMMPIGDKGFKGGAPLKQIGNQIITRGKCPLRAILISDKPLYKPGDIVFFSVIFLSPYNHYLPLDSYVPLELKLNIQDPTGASINTINYEFTVGAKAKKIAASLLHDIKPKARGGIYLAKLEVNYEEVDLPSVQRTFRVREYHKPKVAASKLTLEKQVYFGGDQLNAKLKVRQLNGDMPPTGTTFSFILYVIIYIYIYIFCMLGW